jgi:hypothetical protein
MRGKHLAQRALSRAEVVRHQLRRRKIRPGHRPPHLFRQRGQGAELLGNHERDVVRQHGSAGTYTDGGGARRDVAYYYGRRGAGNTGTIVVFGERR